MFILYMFINISIGICMCIEIRFELFRNFLFENEKNCTLNEKYLKYI